MPLCHGTGAPSDEHRRPVRKKVKKFLAKSTPLFKVFCALVATVKTCVLRVTKRKEGRQLFSRKKCIPKKDLHF